MEIMFCYSNDDNHNDDHKYLNDNNDNNDNGSMRKKEITDKLTKQRSFTDLYNFPTLVSHTLYTGAHRLLNFIMPIEEDMLYKAAKEGNLQKLKEILEHDFGGEQITFKGRDDWTPLIVAVVFNHIDCVEELLLYGADINCRTSSGCTPLLYASMKGHTNLVEFLLKYNCDVDSKDNYGSSALIEAAKNGNTHTVSILLNHGCDINTIDNQGNNALHQACKNNHLKCVIELVKANINVNHSNNHGEMAIMLAALEGASDIVKHLVNKCDISNKDKGKWTALMHAGIIVIITVIIVIYIYYNNIILFIFNLKKTLTVINISSLRTN